jgi:hypothetical protein
VLGSYCISFTLPVSITNTTSSMVMDVSAMFVARTTLRTPVHYSHGRRTKRCMLSSLSTLPVVASIRQCLKGRITLRPHKGQIVNADTHLQLRGEHACFLLLSSPTGHDRYKQADTVSCDCPLVRYSSSLQLRAEKVKPGGGVENVRNCSSLDRVE